MFTNLPREFIELDALRKIRAGLWLALVTKEDLLNDFLAVTSTFNVAAAGDAFICEILLAPTLAKYRC
jgi:hypothetical protein